MANIHMGRNMTHEADATAELRKLINRASKGELINEQLLASTVKRAGRNATWFASEVAREKERLENIELANMLPGLHQKFNEINYRYTKLHEQLKAEYDNRHRKFLEDVGKLRAEQDAETADLQAEILKCTRAKNSISRRA